VRIAVMCIGNELLMDDGVGPACARYLESRYAFPPNVEVLDRAVMGMAIISDLRACDYMVVLDAVDVPDASPGTVFSFDPSDVAPSGPGTVSLHDVRFADVLGSAELLGIHVKGHCFGIQVQNMSPSEFVTALTPRVAAAVPLMTQAAVRFLRAELNLEVTDVLAATDPYQAGCGSRGSRDFSASGTRPCGEDPRPEVVEPCLPEVWGRPDTGVLGSYLAKSLEAVGAHGEVEDADAPGRTPVTLSLSTPTGEAYAAADALGERFGLELLTDAGHMRTYRATVHPQTTDYDCDNLVAACLDHTAAVSGACGRPSAAL
jgi:hydrogenase maturation protease